jgi:hypothetical protein
LSTPVDEIKKERNMRLDKEDIKHGIDTAADLLKDATDHISTKGHEVAEKTTERRIELTLKVGDTLIAAGQKLKDSTKDSNRVQRPGVPEPVR